MAEIMITANVLTTEGEDGKIHNIEMDDNDSLSLITYQLYHMLHDKIIILPDGRKVKVDTIVSIEAPYQ